MKQNMFNIAHVKHYVLLFIVYFDLKFSIFQTFSLFFSNSFPLKRLLILHFTVFC